MSMFKFQLLTVVNPCVRFFTHETCSVHSPQQCSTLLKHRSSGNAEQASPSRRVIKRYVANPIILRIDIHCNWAYNTPL